MHKHIIYHVRIIAEIEKKRNQNKIKGVGNLERKRSDEGEVVILLGSSE